MGVGVAIVETVYAQFVAGVWSWRVVGMIGFMKSSGRRIDG